MKKKLKKKLQAITPEGKRIPGRTYADDLQKRLGQVCKEEREKRGLRLIDLGRLAEQDHGRNVANLEKGEIHVSMKLILSIFMGLGYDLDRFNKLKLKLQQEIAAKEEHQDRPLSLVDKLREKAKGDAAALAKPADNDAARGIVNAAVGRIVSYQEHHLKAVETNNRLLVEILACLKKLNNHWEV